MVMAVSETDDGPLRKQVQTVVSDKLANAIRRKANREGSVAKVVRDLFDADSVQALLQEDRRLLNRRAEKACQN